MKDYAEVTWGFKTNPGPLVSLFQWSAAVEVTSHSWTNGQSTSVESSLFGVGTGELTTDVIQAMDAALAEDSVEIVYHRTVSRSHTCLGLRCKTCILFCAIQFGKGAPLEKLHDLQVALACWLGIVAPVFDENGAK